MRIPSRKTGRQCVRADRKPFTTPHAATGVLFALILFSAGCSCPWLDAGESSAPAVALTWNGDADLDLELHPLPVEFAETAPLAFLADTSIPRLQPVKATESVSGADGERLTLDAAIPAGRYAVVARFWSVGPTNVRRTEARLTVTPDTAAPPLVFDARLDDDTADLWIPCLIDLPSRRVTPRGERLFAEL